MSRLGAVYFDFHSNCREVLRGHKRTPIDTFSLHDHFTRSSATRQRLRQVSVHGRVQVIALVPYLIRKDGKNKVTEMFH